MNFSRRHLLASLGLVLPTMAVIATEANAATTTQKKHKSTKHSASAQAPHKSTKHTHTAAKTHKPASHPSTQG